MKRLAYCAAIFILHCLLFTKTAHASTFDCRPITDNQGANACAAAGKVVCGQAINTCCPTRDDCPPLTSTASGVCDVIQDAGQKTDCEHCMNNGQGSWTAIGCIEADPGKFIAKFLGIGIGMAGGIAFLLILFSGFQIMTSAGNPEQLTAAKELMGSAIAGLLLIIFSIFLLQLIGVSILGIPGFK